MAGNGQDGHRLGQSPVAEHMGQQRRDLGRCLHLQPHRLAGEAQGGVEEGAAALFGRSEGGHLAGEGGGQVDAQTIVDGFTEPQRGRAQSGPPGELGDPIGRREPAVNLSVGSKSSCVTLPASPCRVGILALR